MHLVAKQTAASNTTAIHPDWKFTASVYLRRHHCLLYRDEQLGIQKQVMTRRKPVIFVPNERVYFFIDGVQTIFHSEDRMLRAWKQLIGRRSSS
jgi:hypothetical protein